MKACNHHGLSDIKAMKNKMYPSRMHLFGGTSATHILHVMRRPGRGLQEYQAMLLGKLLSFLGRHCPAMLKITKTLLLSALRQRVVRAGRLP